MPEIAARTRTWMPRRRIKQEEFTLKIVFLGALGALALGAMLALGSALVVQLTALDERVLEYVMDAGSFVVLGLTTFFIGRHVGNHGLLYGVSVGLVYSVSGALLGLVLLRAPVRIVSLFARSFLLMLTGALGSILGVNV
jgi:putative membrane protein (TIGR04086 family)